MTILAELAPASFKGVPFLIDKASTTTGGRKTVTHEFVNSDRRNVEDLGKQLKTFTMTGIITNANDNYIQDRNNLITVLEESGKGILVHPFFGRATVVSKPYSLSEDLTSLGEARFSLTFELADDIVLPQADTSGISEVSDAADIANETLASDVADNFSVADGFADAFTSATALLNQAVAAFDDITELFSPANELVSEFSSALTNFNTSITQLINAPTALGTSILGLFTQVQTILPNVENKIETLANFFTFNSISGNLNRSVDVGNDISQETAEIILNEQMITRQMQNSALALAYVEVVLTEFTNIDDLDETVDILETQYQVFIADPEVPAPTLNDMQDLRALAEIFLAEQRLNINDVEEINVRTQPVQVLAYTLYGNLDNTQTLIDLNKETDVSHIEGQVKVLVE